MLKDTQIKALKPKDKSYTVADGEGLSLVVNPNKSKKWRYRYRIEGKAKTLSLGAYPEVSIADAREKLRKVRAMVANGIDPSKARKEEKITKVIEETKKITFREVKKQWLDSIESNVSTHHYKRSESLMRLYAMPVLEDQQMEDITYKDVRAIIVALDDSGKKESAMKLYGALNKLFSYATHHDYCEVNVCKLIEIKAVVVDQVTKHFKTITEPDAVKLLLENIKNFEGGHYSTKFGLLFMALTSLRSTNVRSARWKYIDFKNKTMTIPKEEMKIKKTKMEDSEDFVLPLADQTIDLLKKVKQFSGHGKYIFPSIRGDRPMSENAMLVMIRSLGYTKEEFVPHGFRAMFSTIANDEENGFSNELIDAQLSHKVGNKVSQSYNRGNYFSRRIPLAQWWADWLDA